ncbi:hypothetical protein HPP92_019881 [Vanilla planifolia]|uniref:Uncharacterized protein n=1 Tax=Vanilla planifolia TaxID=51239 RepID=A0A835Q9M9_VANPL|nr:hypothetical protein HPP92_019873 [Vanilla planifolia]KAG0463812.1 hypothetical protein HPP92_019881 [Vanilla planifolia]
MASETLYSGCKHLGNRCSGTPLKHPRKETNSSSKEVGGKKKPKKAKRRSGLGWQHKGKRQSNGSSMRPFRESVPHPGRRATV